MSYLLFKKKWFSNVISAVKKWLFKNYQIFEVNGFVNPEDKLIFVLFMHSKMKWKVILWSKIFYQVIYPFLQLKWKNKIKACKKAFFSENILKFPIYFLKMKLNFLKWICICKGMIHTW